MLTTERAAYDQNDVESDVAAYIIEISIKIWVRQYAVYVDPVVAGPIIPWFFATLIMVEMFFVSV